MTSFDWKKNIEDSIKDGLIITATTTGIFYVPKGGRHKATKSVFRCYGYHEACRWNMWRSIGQRLRGLRKVDR